MQRIISDHFQGEIKLTKEITTKEKAIASKKIELKEKQIRLINFPSNIQLNEKINFLLKEIENNYKIIEEKLLLQDNNIKKRSEIKKMIGLQNIEYVRNLLNECVEYFLLLMKNLNLESKKFADSSELKIKDLQLDALTSQIKAKDLLIEKSNFKVDFANDKTYKAIDSQPHNKNIKETVSQGKNSNLDINLINGLKGKKSVNKSQIFKSEIDDLKVHNNEDDNNKIKIKDLINKQPLDNQEKFKNKKNNYFKNFKKLINNVIQTESSKKDKISSNKEDDTKISKSDIYSRKIESTRNIHNKNLNAIKSANDALLIVRTKSPQINKADNNIYNSDGVGEIFLNKKSITDKRDMKGMVEGSYKKNHLDSNKNKF